MTENRLIHDFPRLAKESGFYFHFRLKRVEWEEIAKLDLEDIASNQRFELLEEKMELVINNDLDDEITKVLDSNFVKLFRLAQLSVGYLRHCQLYLDRCVLLLQEQLSAVIQERDVLKEARENRDISKCKICEKKFLSESYLDSHQRRRHGNSRLPLQQQQSVGIQTDAPALMVPAPRTTHAEQQTDRRRTVTSETQTVQRRCLDVGVMTEGFSEETERRNDLNEQLRKLYDRLEAVEARANAAAPSINSGAQPVELLPNIPLDSVASLTLLLQNLMPLLQKPPHAAAEVPVGKQETPLIDFSTPTQVPTAKPEVKEKRIKENSRLMEMSESATDSSNEDGSIPVSLKSTPRSRPAPKPKTQEKVPSRTRRKILLPEKVDTETPTQPTQPIPRPRSATITRQKSVLVDVVEFISNGDDIPSDRRRRNPEVKQFLSEVPEDKPRRLEDRKDPQQFSDANLERLVKENATKVHQKLMKKEEITQKVSTQNDTFDYKQLKMQKPLQEPDLGSGTDFIETPLRKKPKSFFKNLVRRNSPKLKGLGQSLKRSWSNLYDSKFSTAEHTQSSATAALLEECSGDVELDGSPNVFLNTKLRELGVDPDWPGIPDDSLARVMATIKHQEAIKAKTTPIYSELRERIEAMVEQRLKEFNTTEAADLNEPTPLEPTTPMRSEMYDIDSETESDDYTPAVVHASSVTPQKPGTPGENSISSEKQVTNEALKTVNKDQSKEGTERTATRSAQSPREMSTVTPFTSDKPTRAKETDFSMFEVAKAAPPQPSARGLKTGASQVQLPQREPSPKDQHVTQEGSEERIIPISERGQTAQPRPEKPQDSSDSSETDEREKHTEPLKLKSAILSKGKDETKKRVVFADNFELETSHDLLTVPTHHRSSSSSSSDWDIPMP